MNKKHVFTVLVLSAMLVFSACSNEPAENEMNGVQEGANNEVGQGNNPEDVNDANEGIVEGEVEVSLPDTQPAELPVTVAQLSNEITVGNSKDEVLSFMGESYQETTAVLDSSQAWRFDYGTSEEYSYDSESDSADQEGLKSGEILLQVFIYFDSEETVSGYSAYQANDEGEVTVFHLMADGTTKQESL